MRHPLRDTHNDTHTHTPTNMIVELLDIFILRINPKFTLTISGGGGSLNTVLQSKVMKLDDVVALACVTYAGAVPAHIASVQIF